MDEKDCRDPLLIEGNRLVKVTDKYDGGDIIVPEGVEIICAEAGYGTHAGRIVLPESLKRIERDAFADLNWLDEPVYIPAGVEHIDIGAFSEAREEPSACFNVDERNPYYYSENGVLHEKKPPEPGIYDAQETIPLTEARADIKEWGIVTFGRYQQTESGKDRTPIEWLVLRKEKDRALLLSRYALETMPYDKNGFEGVSWKRCTLRKWLNMFFYNTAFTEQEQSLFLPTAGRDKCEEEDKLFVLERSEARDAFENVHTGTADFSLGWYRYEDSVRCCLGTPYALAQGADRDEESGFVEWWCCDNDWRHGQTYAFRVDHEGQIRLLNAWNKETCVRPALWVRLKDGE